MPLDQYLLRMAKALQPRIPVTRVSVREVDGDSLCVVGVWSSGPTLVGKGTVMHVGATSINEVLAADGAPFIRDNIMGGAGLAEDVVAGEGVASYMSIVVNPPGGKKLVLTVSSSKPNAFLEEVVDQIVALARRLEQDAAALTW